MTPKTAHLWGNKMMFENTTAHPKPLLTFKSWFLDTAKTTAVVSRSGFPFAGHAQGVLREHRGPQLHDGLSAHGSWAQGLAAESLLLQLGAQQQLGSLDATHFLIWWMPHSFVWGSKLPPCF